MKTKVRIFEKMDIIKNAVYLESLALILLITNE